jgi:xylulokinase
LIEGIAFATNHILQTYAEAGAPPRTIHAVGGGLRNRLWTQATSDVSGYAQEAHKVSIGAAYGDALLAALAIGDVPRDGIKTWNPTASRIEPDSANADVYRRRYAVFHALYSQTKDLMARWIADDGP